MMVASPGPDFGPDSDDESDVAANLARLEAALARIEAASAEIAAQPTQTSGATTPVSVMVADRLDSMIARLRAELGDSSPEE